MSRDTLKKTGRGFVIYGEGHCLKNIPWDLIESSIAGDPRCWVFVRQGGEDNEGGSLHLNIKLAQELSTHLEKFIRDRVAVYGEGICTYGIRWKLADEPGDPQTCCLSIDGRLRGGGQIRQEAGKLWLDRTLAKTLQDHLGLFLEDSGSPAHWKNDPDYIAVWRSDDQSLFDLSQEYEIVKQQLAAGLHVPEHMLTTPTGTPVPPMTMVQASAEATNRWGKYAVLRDQGPKHKPRYMVGESHDPSDPSRAVLVHGEGDTWEEAFAGARGPYLKDGIF